MARTIAKDYDVKRRMILDHAARLFADEGFDRTSVSSVAKVCDISKANIYHYYSSKDDILFDILDSYLSRLRDRIADLDVTGRPPEDQFRLTLIEILLAYQGADHEHRLQTNAMGHLAEDKQEVLRVYQRGLLHQMKTLIRAVAPDVFTDDKTKLHVATMSVFGMLNWFYMWQPDADADQRTDYAMFICDLCLKGIPGLRG